MTAVRVDGLGFASEDEDVIVIDQNLPVEVLKPKGSNQTPPSREV